MLAVIYKVTVVDGFSITINNVVIRSDDRTIARALAIAHIDGKEGSIDYTRRGSRIIEVRDATGTTVYRMPDYTPPEDEHVFIPHERV